MNSKTYKCICGKIFDNPQKFNGHKTQCKQHLIEAGKYEVRKNLQNEFYTTHSKTGAQVRKTFFDQQRALKQELFLSIPRYCEKCGVKLTNIYGSGRFCSRHCANSRARPIEVKQNISKGVVKTLLSNPQNFKYNFKSGYYEGFFCRSSYELVYLVWCKLNNIDIEKVNTCFEYINPDDKSRHKYIPDFYHPSIECYVELKGHHPYFNFDEVAAKCEAVQRAGFGLLYIDDSSICSYKEKIKNMLNIDDITCLYEEA